MRLILHFMCLSLHLLLYVEYKRIKFHGFEFYMIFNPFCLQSLDKL